MKKYFLLIAGTTLSLFLIGFLIGPFVSQWTAKIIGEEMVGLSLSDFVVAPVSLGLLLAFCTICAGCLTWAYSRNGFQYDPKIVFGLDLFISLGAAVLGIGFKILRFRFILQLADNQFDNTSMAMGAVNYFSLGFGLPLFMNAIIIAILLWLARRRREQKDALLIHKN